ncbi:hypothetical protein MMC12_003599 [Toensbergia leucococca]|nr:hypothetical protein [Toensbergia leucococca]
MLFKQPLVKAEKVIKPDKLNDTTHGGGGSKTVDSCKSKTNEGGRIQPWKGHWPPKANTELKIAYGIKEGDIVTIGS